MEITSLFIFLLANYFIYAVRPATITINNNCAYRIWPGILTINGTANSTGMAVDALGSSSFSTSGPWSGRVWARYGCSDDTGKVVCVSGDCGSGQIPCNGAGPVAPATLGEWSIKASQPDRIDTYSVSLVTGFNFPMMITPKSGNACRSASCPIDINAECPEDLVVKDGYGGTLGCKSACTAFGKPNYCCTPPYSTPATCKPTNYSQFFKRLCPQAYSYEYDDTFSKLTCDGETDYIVTFCP